MKKATDTLSYDVVDWNVGPPWPRYLNLDMAIEAAKRLSAQSVWRRMREGTQCIWRAPGEPWNSSQPQPLIRAEYDWESQAIHEVQK